MIPKGFLRKRGRCGSILKATVLCSLVSFAYAGTTVLQQTPAQDRSFFDSILGGGWGSSPPAHSPPMNIPDVAGFGMYPLWKFHKFDGLSLRPVPYGVDIGSGIPPSPAPPNYPTGFLSSPSPASPQYYGPPANPPATNYEASSAPAQNYNSAPAQSYSNSAPQQSYSNSAPQQNYNSAPQQSYGNSQQQNYGSAPSYNSMSSPSYNSDSQAGGYQPNTINLSYQPVQQAPMKYNEPQQSYNAPAAPSYGEPQNYGPPQSNMGYGNQMNSASGGYDNSQYGSGSGITIQFSAVPQEYGMQQQQPSYGSQQAGSYQMPTYTSIESPMSAVYPPMESKPMQMEGYGSGSFLKRSSPGFDKDKKSEAELSSV